MKFPLLFSIAVTSVLSACQPTPKSALEPQKNNHVSQGVYEVEFAAAQRFAQQSHQLAQLFDQQCQLGDIALPLLKEQWQQTIGAWMFLQGQERGPAKALEQSWNVQFWPDKKDTTGRKMSLLASSGKHWSEEQIANQSVTVQGIGALEWLLYDAQSPLLKNQQLETGCMIGQAISANLATKSHLIAEQWQQNPWLMLDLSAWQAEYIALLSNQLDYSMKKLSRPLANIGQPRPYFSESWRAKVSLNNLQKNVQAMQALYLAKDGLDQMLRERDQVAMAERVKAHLSLMLETWPQTASLFDLLQTKTGYREVLALYNKFEQLNYLLHDEVAVELGVVIGFNATDGD